MLKQLWKSVCNSFWYGFYDKGAEGVVVEVNRHLSTDAGKYELKAWAESFQGRKRGELMIRRLRIYREYEGKLLLVGSCDWLPANGKYIEPENCLLDYLVSYEDQYKLTAIFRIMNRKVGLVMLKVLGEEDAFKARKIRVWLP